MSALQEAVRLTKRATPRAGTSQEITAALNRAKIKSVMGLFGVEKEGKIALKGEIAALSGYLPFDMECLKWRHKNGLPKLVLFSLESPEFHIRVYDGGYKPNRHVWQSQPYSLTDFTPKLPAQLSDAYADVVALMTKERHVRGEYTICSISARFSGFIPDEAREKIREASPLFEKVYLVAEPVKMKMELQYAEVAAQPARLPRDPIAVGWDGAKLWYICDFDVTPVEEAALLMGPANK